MMRMIPATAQPELVEGRWESQCFDRLSMSGGRFAPNSAQPEPVEGRLSINALVAGGNAPFDELRVSGISCD
jgi:hypothetical protein